LQEVPGGAETADLVSTAFAGLRIASAQTRELSAMDSLRLCFARVKITPTWDLLCKTFVLSNLADIDSLTVLLLLFSETMTVNTDTAKDLVRYLSSYKHTRGEYTDMFALVLDETHCQVLAPLLLPPASC
jgi:hypothetical protein